jgi:dTDP-4-dehydrorhamnose reductase
MHTLITGGAGLLGSYLIRLAPPAFKITATQRTTLVSSAPAVTVDLADDSAVKTLLAQSKPSLVIHTAYGANHERDIVVTTRNIAHACTETGAALIHLSTDALFDGLHAPYSENDLPDPITPYGRSKAEAEALIQEIIPTAAIVRTSLITEFAPLDPRSAWVANALRNREPITLFVDELRCPIRPDDLAMQLWELATMPSEQRRGMWHLVGPEVVSRYALGVLIAAHEQVDPAGITPAYTDPALRPRDLRLTTTRADRALTTRARSISTLLMDTLKSASL